MRFLSFATLDSTMSECARRMGGDETYSPLSESILELPFQDPRFVMAVFASQQSHGRGQKVSGSSRSWVSPPGQLYLTVVIKQYHPCLSLMAGAALARFIHRVIGFAPTLKWPNDLYIDGQKLAGVLVESNTIQGYSLVGVGMNISGSPCVAAAHLSQWTDDVSPQVLAQDFTVALCSEIYQVLQPSVTSDERLALADLMAPYMMMPGLWLNTEGDHDGVYAGINDHGHLLVSFNQETSPRSFASSTLAPKPGFDNHRLGSDKSCTLWFEMGHSRVKSQLSQSLYPRSPILCQKAWCFSKIDGPQIRKDLNDWMTQYPQITRRPIYLASGGDSSAYHALITLLDSLGLRVVVIPKKTHRLQLDESVFDQIGFDRICVMEGALARVYHRHCRDWFMVVSFGTAIVVNFCSKAGEFLGGAIMPSEKISFRALQQQVSSLSDIKFPQNPQHFDRQHLGLNTQQALAIGQMARVIGSVEHLFHQAFDVWPDRRVHHQVFVSGGGAQLYKTQLILSLKNILRHHAPDISSCFEGVCDVDVISGLRSLAVAAHPLSSDILTVSPTTSRL